MNGTPDNATEALAPSFGEEFRQYWERLPNKAFFFGLLGVWLLLFHLLGNCTFGYINTSSLLKWMWNAYNGKLADDQHGLLVPLVVVVLFWWKRKELLATKPRLWPPGLLLLALALALHLAGYVVQQQRVSIVALFAGIYALMGLAWGPGWLRASFFPYFLLAFCVPLSGMSEVVTLPLRILVTKIVAGTSQALGMDVLREGTQLFNSQHSYQYEVAAACSGLRSVIAILCIATIYGFLNFEQNWKRALMIASAIPLAVVSNVIRMLCIILAAEIWGQSGGETVHDNWFFSILPYVPAIGGVWLLGRCLEKWRLETPVALKPKAA